MSGIYDLTGKNIENTYQRVLQTPDGTTFYDGTGSLVTLPSANTSSLLTTASAAGNTITFTKGDGSTFPVTVTGGGTPGGLNTQIQFNSASVFSGSSKLTYDYVTSSLTLTGSLNITGSTLQVGNNTLLGNTLLTGSITISGSNPPGSPTASVQIYGDIRQSGYHRFDPVTTNIDTSISASYIYVSGSTQDMYFSQNGSGYNNVTRLRWLESTLGTGLLKGGNMTSTPGSNTFTVAAGEGIVVSLNASLIQDPYPVIKLVSWPTQTLPILYSASAKITYVGIDNTGTVVQQVAPWGSLDINQWDNSINLGVILTLSGSVSTGVFNAPQISYGPQQQSDDFFRAFGPLKISGHTLRASGSTLGIIQDAGTAYREGSNYINNPNHPSTTIENSINVSKIYRYHLSGSTPVIDTGVGAAGYTTIDPTKRVNTATGNLVSVSTNKYSLQRVFWFPNSPTQAFIVYYGNAQYDSLIDAINAKDSEPFTEAPNTALNAIFLGYIAIAGGATDLTNATDATILQGGIFRSVGGVGSSGTNFVSTTLAGLADVSINPNPPSKGDLLVYGAAGDSQWNNSKQLTGSYGLTGSLTITQNVSASSFTGSLFGTASVSDVAYSASITANNSTNASYLLPFTDRLLNLNSQTGSVQLQTDQNLYYNPATNILNANVTFATSASYASGSTSASYADTASYALSASWAPTTPIGPGLENTLALWDTTSTVTSSSITYLTDTSATNQATVSQSLYNINADGLKIGNSNDITQLSSSLNSNIFVNNTSPASNYIQVGSSQPGVIKRLDLFNYNIVDKSGCYGMIIDFSLLLCDKVALEQYRYKFDVGAWPQRDRPYYVETGRIYLSWLGADYDLGGAVGKSGTPNRYITMARTIPNAESSGWDTVPDIPGGIYPTQTSLAASEEGVVAPYGAPVYRDQADGYQFGYKLVNNALGEWYVEVAVWNDTPSNMFITHTTKILTLFTNP